MFWKKNKLTNCYQMCYLHFNLNVILWLTHINIHIDLHKCWNKKCVFKFPTIKFKKLSLIYTHLIINSLIYSKLKNVKFISIICILNIHNILNNIFPCNLIPIIVHSKSPINLTIWFLNIYIFFQNKFIYKL
jgi:hypothetical protein